MLSVCTHLPARWSRALSCILPSTMLPAQTILHGVIFTARILADCFQELQFNFKYGKGEDKENKFEAKKDEKVRAGFKKEEVGFFFLCFVERTHC